FVFTNLYFVHSYYLYANSIFLVMALSICIIGLLDKDRMRQTVGVTIFLACVVSSIVGYYKIFYPLQNNNNKYLADLGAIVRRNTSPEDVFVCFGLDWSPELAYYSKRRALMWPVWMVQDTDSEPFRLSIQRLKKHPIGALVVCFEAKANQNLIQKALATLG